MSWYEFLIHSDRIETKLAKPIVLNQSAVNGVFIHG